MKKIFTLIAIVLLGGASVDAKKVLESTWNPWNENATVDGNKLSFTAAWSGAGYQLAGETAPLDLSDYDYIVVKMAKCSDNANFAIEYTKDGTPVLTDDNKTATNASAAAGSTIVGIPLDINYSTNVVQMWVQATTASLDVEISEVYAATEEEYLADKEANKQTTSDITLNGWDTWGSESHEVTSDGYLKIDFTAAWGGTNLWLGGFDASDFDYCVIEIEPTNVGTQLFIQYTKKKDGADYNAKVMAAPGQTEISILLDKEYKNAINQIAVQADGVGTVIVKKAYWKAESGNTPAPTESTVLWEGECVFDNWTGGFSVTADKFANANAGDVIEFVYTTAETTETWWQIKTIYAETETTLEGNAGDLNEYGCASVSQGSTSYKITLTANDVANLKEKGLFANGHFLVVTKVNLIKATGIGAVEIAKPAQSDVMYNLAGQKVGADYKGIVIKNGKKMVVK